MSEFTAFHAAPFEARFLNLPELIPEKLWAELTEKLHYDVDTPEALASDQYAARAGGMRRLHTAGAATVIWKAALAACEAERWISRASDSFLGDLLGDPLLEDLREILGGADSAAFRALSDLWTSAGFVARSERQRHAAALPWWLDLRFSGSAAVGFSDPPRLRDIVKGWDDTGAVSLVLGLLRGKPEPEHEESLAGDIEGLSAFFSRAATRGDYVVGLEWGT